MGTKRALIIVDLQEDFCPPNGALAVTGGRDIVPLINNLLCLPFDLKVATKDFHPQNHISFASNHAPPDNAIGSAHTVANPYNEKETQVVYLWPDHCVQGTRGVELVPDLDLSRVDHIIEKGQDSRVEMFSAFEAPLFDPPVARSDLEDTLRSAGITDIYVVGLASDFCVRWTAVDGARHGFRTYVIEEATRAVWPEKMAETHADYEQGGITRTTMDEVKQVF